MKVIKKMIIANGIPKSGTHALMALLQTWGYTRLNGILKNNLELLPTKADPKIGNLERYINKKKKCFIHAHLRDNIEVPEGAFIITVFRNPKNVLISYARWSQNIRFNEEGIIESLDNYFGNNFVQEYTNYLGWFNKGLIIRYEALSRNKLKDISVYSGKIDSSTITSLESNWRNYWTDNINNEWLKQGGPKLMRSAGYSGEQ